MSTVKNSVYDDYVSDRESSDDENRDFRARMKLLREGISAPRQGPYT